VIAGFGHRSFTVAALIGLTIGAGVVSARDRIAFIEFFGYKGLDPEAVRSALPFHAGDPKSPGMQAQARATVKRVTGRDATNVAFICCVNDGDTAIFIGLPGASSQTFVLNPRPKQDLSLSAELMALHGAMEEAEDAAAIQMEVDTPSGYRLMQDPKARAAELKVRDYALKHEDELVRVLSLSSDDDQRAIAADTLGYGNRSPMQMSALVYAARDPDDTVRNNVTRALGEILRADPAAAARVPPDNFIDMIRSGTWTDRNKSSDVLGYLTRSRDPKLLGRLKVEAWDALLEMARWAADGWAADARLIMARIAGVPEERALDLRFVSLQAFLDAMGQK
jgi:hypothetical protein